MKKIKNIAEALNADFTNKKDVSYLMVELGKFLESDNNKYQTLSFYRNWSVHSKINNLKKYKNFFTKIDKEIKRYLKSPSTKTRHSINKEIKNFLSFKELKSEFSKFLLKYNLPKNLIDSEEIWNNFVKNLREIILEIPIEIKDIKKSIPESKIRYFHLTNNPLIIPKDFEVIAWQIWTNNSDFPLIGYLEETLAEKNKLYK